MFKGLFAILADSIVEFLLIDYAKEIFHSYKQRKEIQLVRILNFLATLSYICDRGRD